MNKRNPQLTSIATGPGNRQKDSKDEKERSLKDVVCYGCREKGHAKRRSPKQAEAQGQTNVCRWKNKQ